MTHWKLRLTGVQTVSPDYFVWGVGDNIRQQLVFDPSAMPYVLTFQKIALP